MMLQTPYEFIVLCNAQIICKGSSGFACSHLHDLQHVTAQQQLLQSCVVLTGTPWWESQQKMHDLPDGDEVLQRLGHLEAFYGEVASV